MLFYADAFATLFRPETHDIIMEVSSPSVRIIWHHRTPNSRNMNTDLAETPSVSAKVRRRTTRQCRSPVSRASLKVAVTVITFSLVLIVTVVTTTIGKEQQRRNLLRHLPRARAYRSLRSPLLRLSPALAQIPAYSLHFLFYFFQHTCGAELSVSDINRDSKRPKSLL